VSDELRVLALDDGWAVQRLGDAPHCCDDMRERLAHRCAQHENPFDCPDNLVFCSPKFSEYGLIVHDGGPSYIRIAFCPWCGARLPKNKRDLWFDTLEAMGFKDPVGNDSIPEDFKSDRWWLSAAAAEKG
jgi:hypothetical protein